MADASPASVAEFKVKFDRDFPYGTGLDAVRDRDIERAMGDVLAMWVASMFGTAAGKTAFLYATAHCLVTNVQGVGGLVVGGMAPAGGLANQAEGPITSKGLGPASLSYEPPPDFVKHNAKLLYYWPTTYGQKAIPFLASRTCGAVSVVAGPIAADVIVAPNIPYAGP